MEFYDNNIEAIDRYIQRATKSQREGKAEAARRNIEEAYSIAEETGDLARQTVVSVAKRMRIELDR